MRRSALPLIAVTAMLVGCSDQPTQTHSPNSPKLGESAITPAAATNPNAPPGTKLGAGVLRDLATLRQVTAPFHSFDRANASGWNTMITACMTDPTLGGMGFHYGNTNLIDGRVRVDEPELLLYEPEANGRMRLVAVEYIMPLTASAVPPRLFDRDFKPNLAFGIWALHAWVWKDNPSGIFADWNPRVTCPAGTSMSTMSH
ncbi:MAG: hypothetical protein ABIT38_10985 [Gemmatimonadaceae bacterium]